MTTHRKTAPTGDPKVPIEVALAKAVKAMIGNKACLGGGEDVYDMEGGVLS